MVASAVASVLPPADGWRDVYTFAVIEGRPERDVAALLGLPCEEVRDIKNRVLTWLATNSPLYIATSRDEGLQMAEMVARQQLEYCYAEAMKAWHRSQTDEVTVRQEGMLAKTSRTTRSSYGQVRYMALAMKLCEALTKIPIRHVPRWLEPGNEPPALDLPASAAERMQEMFGGDQASDPLPPSGDGRRERWAGDEPVNGSEGELDAADRVPNPPEGDCSLDGGLPRDFVDVLARSSGASADCTEQWTEMAEGLERLSDENARHLETVQTAEQPAGGARPLSRQQRRRRERLLQQLRKRKPR